MRCLNCGFNQLQPEADICPKCNVALVTLFWDMLPRESQLHHGSYLIEYPLGQGGFGITYRGFDLTLDRPVAIKEYYPRDYLSPREQTTGHVQVKFSLQDEFQRSLRKFIREGQLLARIDHPNIVKVFGAFQEHGTAYLVMELIEGTTLRDLLDQQKVLAPDQVKMIMNALVKGLTACHKQKIYHLDLAPDNIMLSSEGCLKLLDFGASRQNGTVTTYAAYKQSYAPLEVQAGSEVGPGSDLFELGMILHELLTGELPPSALDRQIKGDQWSPAHLESPWHELITAATRLQLADRPQSLSEWWNPRGKRAAKLSSEATVDPSPSALNSVPPAIEVDPFDSDSFSWQISNLEIERFLEEIAQDSESKDEDPHQTSKTQLIEEPQPLAEEVDASVGKQTSQMNFFDFEIDHFIEDMKQDPLVLSELSNETQINEVLPKETGESGSILKKVGSLWNQFDRKRLARDYVTQGHKKTNSQEALENYIKATELDANYSLAWVCQGNTLINLQRYQEAIAALTQAITANQNWGSSSLEKAYFNRAWALKLSGDQVAALVDLTHAIELDSTAAFMLAFQAELFIDLEYYEEAITSISAALDLNQNWGTWTQAKAYVVRGKAREKLGDQGGALDDYIQATDLDPYYSLAWSCQGLILHQLSRTNEAIQALTQGIMINRHWGSSSLTQAYIDRGQMQKNHEVALKDYLMATETDPQCSAAWAYHGETLIELEKHKAAIDSLTQAIVTNQKWGSSWSLARAYLVRGLVWHTLKSEDKTLEDLSMAVEKDPYFSEALAHHSQASFNLRFYKQAIRSMTQAIEVNQRWESWSLGQCYLVRGLAWEHLGDREQALKDYTKATTLDPNYSLAWAYQGDTLVDLGRYNEAIASLTKAILISQKWGSWSLAKAYFVRGLAWERSGNKQRALQDFTKANQLGYLEA